MARPQAKRPKDAFFHALGRHAITFDEAHLQTGYFAGDFDAIDVSGLFSRNIPLQTPVVSAAMDTVTEQVMAIVMARLGGIGVLHRAQPEETQAKMVTRVKRHLHGRIDDPISVPETWTVERVLALKEEKGYEFDSFLVTDTENRLSGVLTRRDVRSCDPKQVVHDVMTPRNELVTAEPKTTIRQAFRILKERKINLLPLVDRNGRVLGLYVFSDVERVMASSGSLHNTDREGRLRVAAAIGPSTAHLPRAERLADEDVDAFVIDTAQGDTDAVISMIKELKRRYPEIDVVAGNISEAASAKRLVKAGADGLKIGQGPGSICTTRSVTGVGCPQLSAIALCEEAVRGSSIPVCADGGISAPGHLSLALGAGASSVMLGRMLAGTDESPGDLVLRDGQQKMKRYRGMGSRDAMAQSDRYQGKQAPEGVEAVVPYQGPVQPLLGQLREYLKSTFGYVGVSNLEEFHQKADFWLISNPKESGVHDVTVLPDISRSWEGA